MENNNKEIGYILRTNICGSFDNFISDYLKSLGCDTSNPGTFGILVKDKTIVKKYMSFIENNIEKIVSIHNIIPLWIIQESVVKSKIFENVLNHLKKFNSLYGISEASLVPGLVTEKGTPVYFENIIGICSSSAQASTLLYYNALTNTKYADTIRRIFKYYGKECIYKTIQTNKPTEQHLIEFVSSMLGERVDVFDESIKPDEEPKEVQDLFLDVLSTGGKLIDEFIQDHNESKLDEKIKKLMADAANKYTELTASGGTQQQSKSSPESNTDSDIEAPQLDYDEEFNSAPKYNDLEAYTAFIKQQNRQIVEDYARKKEMEMKKENTIETTATVDANGKVLYVAKDDNTFPSYLLNKIFCNKNIMNILKEKFNNTSFHVLLVYSNSIDDYKVFCFNNNIELLFHYIGSESVIQLSEEKF